MSASARHLSIPLLSSYAFAILTFQTVPPAMKNVGKAFPSLLLRAPLPLQAEGIPQRPQLSILRLPSSFAWLKTRAVAPNQGASAMSGSIPLPPACHRPSA